MVSPSPDPHVLVHPDPPPAEVQRLLDLAGMPWSAVDEEVGALNLDHVPSLALLGVDSDPDGGWQLADAIRRRWPTVAVVVLARGNQLDLLLSNHHLYDDFCLSPFHPSELETRLRHALARPAPASAPGAPPPAETDEDLIRYDDLILNLQTYQAAVAGEPLDLTFMEYELLRHLAAHPGRVFTREVLLSQVWGYEYFGGARTVDVHVRRLRSKLGEEHARLIQTVRSVGYRFGTADW